MNKYKAAGIQICPEFGIKREQLIELISIIDDDEYEIISFDANNAICYFIFSFKYFEDIDQNCKVPKFKELFVNIANDMKLETTDRIYYFDGQPIYFGY